MTDTPTATSPEAVKRAHDWLAFADIGTRERLALSNLIEALAAERNGSLRVAHDHRTARISAQEQTEAAEARLQELEALLEYAADMIDRARAGEMEPAEDPAAHIRAALTTGEKP